MNNKLKRLFRFLENKHAINKEAKSFKLTEKQKEDIINYIDSLDFEIKIRASTKLNPHSKQIFDLIKEQILLTYKPYLKSYFQEILDDSAKLNKLMKTMYFDEDWSFETVTKAYYKDPYVMLIDLIKGYRGFLFEIILSTRFENPCGSEALACNDVSSDRRIFFLLDKMFKLDFKINLLILEVVAV